MPDDKTVTAFGALPWPALLVLAGVVLVLGAILIWVKFGDGRREGPKTEDFQVKLATFDPRKIEALTDAMERNTDAVCELGRDVREAGRVLREVERRLG